MREGRLLAGVLLRLLAEPGVAQGWPQMEHPWLSKGLRVLFSVLPPLSPLLSLPPSRSDLPCVLQQIPCTCVGYFTGQSLVKTMLSILT